MFHSGRLRCKEQQFFYHFIASPSWKSHQWQFSTTFQLGCIKVTLFSARMRIILTPETTVFFILSRKCQRLRWWWNQAFAFIWVFVYKLRVFQLFFYVFFLSFWVLCMCDLWIVSLILHTIIIFTQTVSRYNF